MSISYFKKLGERAFTSFYLLSHKQDSKTYEMKQIKMANSLEKEIEQVLKEIHICITKPQKHNKI